MAELPCGTSASVSCFHSIVFSSLIHRPFVLDPRFSPVSPAESSASQRRKQNFPQSRRVQPLRKQACVVWPICWLNSVSESSAPKIPVYACLTSSAPPGLSLTISFSVSSSLVTFSKTPHLLQPRTPLIPLHCFRAPFSTCYYPIYNIHFDLCIYFIV